MSAFKKSWCRFIDNSLFSRLSAGKRECWWSIGWIGHVGCSSFLFLRGAHHVDQSGVSFFCPSHRKKSSVLVITELRMDHVIFNLKSNFAFHTILCSWTAPFHLHPPFARPASKCLRATTELQWGLPWNSGDISGSSSGSSRSRSSSKSRSRSSSSSGSGSGSTCMGYHGILRVCWYQGLSLNTRWCIKAAMISWDVAWFVPFVPWVCWCWQVLVVGWYGYLISFSFVFMGTDESRQEMCQIKDARWEGMCQYSTLKTYTGRNFARAFCSGNLVGEVLSGKFS